MSVYIDTLYHVDTLFSVIDTYLVRSYATPKLPTPLGLKSYHLIKNITIWQSYLITVNKVLHVILHLAVDGITKYLVHDGPGPMSRTLISKSRGTFFCATFQCHVTLLSTSAEAHFITYISEQLPMYLNFSINNTVQMSLPMYECHFMYCFVNIQATNIQYQLNVTVIAFFYMGSPLDRYTCIYGGLVVTQPLHLDKESDTICENDNSIC